MEQKTSIPDNLKNYDTPENRQAYLSYKASVEGSGGLSDYDTPENRQAYVEFMGTSNGQNYKLNNQRIRGLSTSDNRLYRFSDDQMNWIKDRYAKTWEYGHDVLDQEAKAGGYMPPSMYDKYSEKSQYDQWAVQTGMPNEKDLEKYLKDYDDWKTQYNADEAAFNQALADRKASENLLNDFYNDVADRLYRAEFNGVQRGSDKWNRIFFSTLGEEKYASLQRLYAGNDYVPEQEEKKSSKKKKGESEDPYGLTDAERITLESIGRTPGAVPSNEETFLNYHRALRKKAAVDSPDTYRPQAKGAELTQEEVDAIVADKGYYFPEVPDLTFSIGEFTEMFDRNVTKNETDRGYGKVNNAVREAAGKIGYTTDSDPLSDLYAGMSSSGEQTSGGGLSVRNSGKSGLLPKSEGSSLIQSGRTSEKHDYKVPNRTDVASVCKDLAIQGFNSEEYWQVIGGLTAGSPLSPNTPGPGFVFDSATQERTGAYGQVISTRFGTDIMKLAVNDASSEDIDAFVAKAIEGGASKELLWRAYDLVMTALGGNSENDTSRDWDGLSYAERTARDAAFKQRFEAAANQAPSLPVGSGWTGLTEGADIKEITEKRKGFDFDAQAEQYLVFDESARGRYLASLSPEEQLRGTTESFNYNDTTLLGIADKLSEGHGRDRPAWEWAGIYAPCERFRAAAKEHGYSDWEVDQYFRKKGVIDKAPDESWEDYDRRKANNYRQYLIELSGGKLEGEETDLDKERLRTTGTFGGRGGKFEGKETDLDKERLPTNRGTFGGQGGKFEEAVEDIAASYFASISDEDLVEAMKLDAATNNWEGAWAFAPTMALSRGCLGYAAGIINFADMVMNGGDNSGSTWEVAEDLNRQVQKQAAYYRHDNQSGFVAVVTDAGSELVRMYLVSKAGGMFGEVAGGALSVIGTGEAAAWLSSGSKAANLVKWGVESVPFITGAMGSSYAEARAEGATNQQAVQYGVLAGVVEGLTEKLSVELMIGEGGSKVVNKVIGGLMKSGAAGLLKGGVGVVGVNLLKMAMNAVVEGQQEGASYVLDLILKKAIYDPDAEFSWKELGQQMGMGALCGAMGLAFQNYGASYVNSMMEFALSSPKNFQTFSNWAVNQYGANLGTNDNYVVKAEDYDPTKILPANEWTQAWKDYLDANATLSSARKQYEATVASLNEDDAQKARGVVYWKNQVAAGDPSDPKSAAAMAHAMEQLTLAESKAADTEKKNKKLRQDARTELTNARKRAQNIMDETSAKIRAHSRAEIAATLGAANAGLDSSYALASEDVEAAAERGERAAALQAELEETQAYAAAIDDAFNALQQLEQATEAQTEAKAKLYDAAVSTLTAQYSEKPVIAGALDRINELATAQETLAEGLEATAAEMSENLEAAKKEDQIRTANFSADLDSIDSWYGSELDAIDADMVEAERDARDGKITREEYEAAKEQAAERIQTAMSTRDATREAAAVNFAADGGVSQSMEGLANAMRLEASEARSKAAEIRDAVVRALALRTQEAALAAVDTVVSGEGVLPVEQREALTDEMNRLVAEQLMNDDATKAVYDAMEGLKLVEQQAEQKGSEAPQETASEAQNAPVQSEQETTPVTDEQRKAELEKAVAIGKALGVDVKIVDDLPKELNGKYFDDGRILISRNATNAPMQVLVHELAHYMEGTTAYDQLQQYVFSVMAQDPDFNLSVEIAAYRTLYANSRDAMGEAQLSDAEAIQEAKAEIVSRWCEKNLFTSEESINRLCAQETSLGKRILNGIQNMLSGKRSDPALKQLQTAEKLYIKALHQARAFGGAKINRNSVASLLVGAGLYIDSNADGFKVYRTRYNENGDRISIEELKPNLESPCDGPITTDDIMNHSPIGAFIRLGQQFGNIEGFYDTELEPGTNLRAIPSEKLSAGAKIVNLFTDLSNMCLAYGDNGAVWDFVGGYVFSSITSNSDPQYSRTVDYGTICRKTQNLITGMSEAMVQKGRGLYPEEIIELSNELVAAGKLDVPCSMCYVFNRWLGLGGYLNRAKVYQDRYSAMTPDEAFQAFQEVQAQLDEVVDSRNFKTLINDLCAKHGIDPKAYLNELAAGNKAFQEKGKFQATKKEMSRSDARARAIQLYAKLLDDCQQTYDRKSLKDVDTKALREDLETRMGVTDAYGWFTKVLLNENEDGTFSLKRSVLSEDGKSWALGKDGNATFVVPVEILFNMNASDRFATEYPDVWRFRTSGGSALGKATYGYTDARLGEFTYGASVSNVKSQDVPKASRWGIGSETSTAENQPKNKLSFVDSKGEFASGGAATFAKAIQNILNQAWLGGDRMQSSSDYTSKHALDYLITAFEMQCLGAPVQVYSKVPEGLAFFSAIGAGANASLIAKGGGIKGTPVYEFNAESGHYRVVEGSATLDISKVQGIDPDVARAMIESSDNIQGIMVGMNREHTALTISTPWITMCIPVHMSGGTVDNISARAVAQGDPGLTKADVNDATGCQNDKLLTAKEIATKYKGNADMVQQAREVRAKILAGEEVSLNDIRAIDDWVATKYPGNHRLLENMYNAFQKSGAQLKVDRNKDGSLKGLGFGIYPNEYWDTTSTIDNAYVNGDRFQEYCYMLGVTPRFSYGEYGKHGSFPGLHKFEGYWKVLIDRPMYNLDGTYRAVRPVDVSGLTAAMFTGEAKAPIGRNLGADAAGNERAGSRLYNAEESTKMQRDEATAARVGREYSEGLTGTPEEAMRAHSRNALAGDIDAQLAELRKQYGAMPTSGAETAPGRENVVLPKQTNEDTYVRRAAQTFMRSPNVTDASASEIGKAVLRGEFDYERQTNEETEAKATQMIQDLGGQEAALRHLENVARGAARPNAETVALGEQLILDAQAVGDVNAFEKAVVYTAMLGTAAGQTVQAFSMINKLSPEGIALYMRRVIDRLNTVEYKDLIAKGKMKPIELTEDQVARIMSVKSFSEARQVETKILEEIGAQIPLTLKEQLRSWRYLCMLGNIRTNVRNLAGNLAMSSMVTGKNVVAAGLEAWDVARGRRLDRKAAEAARAGDTQKAERLLRKADRHLDRSDRTKTLGIGSNAEAYKANLAYAKGTTDDAIDLLKGGGKDVGLSALREGKRMFNPKWMDKAGKLIMKPLDVGDLWFSKPQYEHAYASWMTARGLTGEDMTLKQRNEAMKYAVNEAQKATFRDANWLATKITEIRSKNLVSELLVGGVMPFAKTPANILRRGVEYSPAGLLQGITQLVKANNAEGLSRSERMQMRVSAIDRMAEGVTGTGLLAIGMLLRKLGVLKGKDDDDKRAANFFRDMGNQAYSIDFGDVNMTVDWLAPLNMPMFMGAAIWDTAEKLSGGEELALEDIADPIMSIADPLIEMSMLSGIQSALKTYGSENALSAIGTNTLQSFAGQFYPTLGGQLARTIDYTRRQPDSKHYWLQSMAAKVPGLSKTVKPYVGGYGDEETFEGGWLLRALEQFISPGYFKAERHDDLTEELARVYEQTGVSNFLPQRPSDYRTLNLGKQYSTWDLTYDEQVEYEKLFRSEAAKALSDAIKMPEYKGLSDADKADFLTEVYQQATKNARKKMKETIMERYQVGSVAATQKP